MAIAIRRLGETTDLLGESPCWDARADALWWVDSLTGTLRRMELETGAAERHDLPAPVGSIALCESGAIVCALKDTFARYDPASRRLETLARLPVDHPQVRLNDGKCDPWGSFLAGTMHTERRPGERVLGGLYRLGRDQQLEQLADDIGFANGPCFSPDGRTLYLADSLERTIWSYDYAPDRPLANKRLFVRTASFDSGPDGAAVDVEGFVWVVLTRAAKLARFAPDGAVERIVELPATYPTSLCFDGAAPGLAYVTSISRSTRLVGERLDDGGLFELRGLSAPGVRVGRFADT
jgi:sugar lactone lactonase YvrE